MSIGRWFLKKFENTDVNEIISELQRLQDKVSSLEERNRKHTTKENTLKANVQKLKQDLKETKGKLRDLTK